MFLPLTYASCSSPTLTTVDFPGSVGWYTSLQLNGVGNAVISYYDTQPLTLMSVLLSSKVASS